MVIQPRQFKPDPHMKVLGPFLAEMGRASYCLKVRSYIVKRESAQSDVTKEVGYQTCTPSAEFQMR